MKVFTVKKPFMSRKGQFQRGKHTLCLGLAESALIGNDKYKCYIGNNKDVSYKIVCQDALVWANDHKSWWVNPEGKRTAILPIFLFKREERVKSWYEEAEERARKEEAKNGPELVRVPEQGSLL